nr:radical SAM protein [uncultured Sphaerochaeta sp.]
MLTLGANNPKALYLHIPFCITCCSYCAFYSEPKASWIGSQEEYVTRLEQEIKGVIQELGGFETIFIGGGNPGSLTEVQLSRLLIAAKSTHCSEVTIEMNPETFSESYFPLFEKKLVTRLSMGIQSMDDSVLHQLGRNAKTEDNFRAIAPRQESPWPLRY